MKKILACLLVSFMISACKSASTKDQIVVVEEKNAVVKTATNNAVNNTDSTSIKAFIIDEVAVDSKATIDKELIDQSSILSARNVYFALDSYVVTAESRPMITAHAQYLLANSNAKIVLQGNADKRGSSEYNLSLGQRRSFAVKQVLNALGVQDKQIETVSFGEEKSNNECADENCFKLNRRVEVVYENQ